MLAFLFNVSPCLFYLSSSSSFLLIPFEATVRCVCVCVNDMRAQGGETEIDLFRRCTLMNT